MRDEHVYVKNMMERNGISIADWARDRGFNVRTVYAVIRGELKCKRGVSHQIAVALGLKSTQNSSQAG